MEVAATATGDMTKLHEANRQIDHAIELVKETVPLMGANQTELKQ